MKIQVRAYLDEARWCNQGYTPSVEEYMNLALVTTGYFLLSVVSFVGMGEIATEESFGWMFNRPKIVRAAEIVCRCMDDIVSHKVYIISILL